MTDKLNNLISLSLGYQEKSYLKEGPKEAGVDFLQSNYKHMLQAKGTEAVIKATATRGKKEIQQYTTGSAYIDFDGIRVNIEEYAKLNLKLTPLTGKLLQLMLIGATQLLNRDAVTEIRLDLNLAEVAEALGRNVENRNTKSKFKREFLNAMEVLSRISLRIEEELNGRQITVGKAHLLSSFTPSETEKDTTEVILGLKFLEYLSMGYLKAFNTNILKISDASSYQFHTAYNNYVTIGRNHLASKEQTGPVKAKIFSIESAIKWAATLPTIEDVKNSDRRYTQRIIEPLEKILDDEHGIIEKWEWCKAKGEKLENNEKENLGSYDVIEKLYVKVIAIKEEEPLLNAVYPATGRIIEAKEKKAKQRAKRVAKAQAIQPEPNKDE